MAYEELEMGSRGAGITPAGRKRNAGERGKMYLVSSWRIKPSAGTALS
jgi:hypothetical protein